MGTKNIFQKLIHEISLNLKQKSLLKLKHFFKNKYFFLLKNLKREDSLKIRVVKIHPNSFNISSALKKEAIEN